MAFAFSKTVGYSVTYSVFQRKDIVQQLENIPFESVVAASGIVCSRPPTQENVVCRNCVVWKG